MMTMSYPSWFEQPATPPYDSLPLEHLDTPIGLDTSVSDIDVSPDYLPVSLPTPVKSPIRQHGPLLLPKIRSQDQDINPDPTPCPRRHRKALSCTHDPPVPLTYAGDVVRRRSLSPPRVCDTISPVAGGPSARGHSCGSSLASTSAPHSRRPSGSHLDQQVLGKYGFPTYRQLPTYIAPPTFVASCIPGTSTFVAPPVVPPRYEAPAETLPLGIPFDPTIPTTTLLANLTSPNPSPALVRHLNVTHGRGSGQTHFWWDVRNIRAWSDFSLDSIDRIPGLMRLLTVELPRTALPAPALDRSKLQLETEANLHELCRDFYAAKINAAMKVAQGPSHMVMRSNAKGPHFVSNYQNDAEKTISGDGRGRVVGLVKSFDRWNTGMRAEAPHRKVEYLQGLAHLHRHMREHGCRYGFIVTEIELVCVRAGTESTPYFGLLELAAPIRLNATEGLTACLALWYLHMLAKEVPLPGQAHWRMDVGGAAACTRQKCLDKDVWIPQPQLAEKREAKRVRGYVLCTDPLHRRELPRSGRRASKQGTT